MKQSMINKIIMLLAVVAIGLGVSLAFKEYDRRTLKRGMPPGYRLQCDGKGHFRPCFENGRQLIWSRGPGTKAKAIRRAWIQYYYVPEPEPKDSGNWTVCD